VVFGARVVQDRFPGIGRAAFGLLRALAASDHGFDLVALHPPRARDSRFDVAALAGAIRLVESEVPPYSVSEQLRLPRLAARLRAELWHAPCPVMPLALPCRRVVTFYDALPLRDPAALRPPWARSLLRVLLRRALRSATRVVAASASAAAEATALFALAEERVRVVPSGVDAGFAPQPATRVAAVRGRLGLPAEYVLHVGSHRPHKNLDGLLAAWRIIADREQLQGLVLVLAGLGTVAAQHEAGVIRTGAVAEADLPALYSGARLLAFPSLWEGSGLPVLEAMACGTAVVCSDRGALPETAGDAALVVDPDEPAALAAGITRLAADAELRARLRARGLARAAAFTWERSAGAVVTAWREALSPHESAGRRKARP